MIKPIIKYQGGKTKELPLIKQLMPTEFNRVIEPFTGGAAVSFALEKPAVLNDINRDVINLYSIVANEELYPQLQIKVDYIKGLEHDDLQEEYYAAREGINQPWDCVDFLQRALSYIIVRQLCFSGMERYNVKGEFNVPFGHYKKFSCNLNHNHHTFLKTCKIYNEDFKKVLLDANSNDFVFLDPPYLDRLGYTSGDGGLNLHEELLSCLKTTNSKWMIVHSDHEFYRDSYKDYNIVTKDFLYSQRFGKGKDHSGAEVKHLYITNYDTNQNNALRNLLK
jgi:DNA adenine methylase